MSQRDPDSAEAAGDERPSTKKVLFTVLGVALLAIGCLMAFFTLFFMHEMGGVGIFAEPSQSACDGVCQASERTAEGEKWDEHMIAPDRMMESPAQAGAQVRSGVVIKVLWCDCVVTGDRMDSYVDVVRYVRVDCGSREGAYVGMPVIQSSTSEVAPPLSPMHGSVVEVSERTSVLEVYGGPESSVPVGSVFDHEL